MVLLSWAAAGILVLHELGVECVDMVDGQVWPVTAAAAVGLEDWPEIGQLGLYHPLKCLADFI